MIIRAGLVLVEVFWHWRNELMTKTNRNRQFSSRALFLLILIVGVFFGGQLSMQPQIDSMNRRIKELEDNMAINVAKDIPVSWTGAAVINIEQMLDQLKPVSTKPDYLPENRKSGSEESNSNCSWTPSSLTQG